MLPPTVEEVVTDILEDHTSGANRIARKGLKGLSLLLDASTGTVDRDVMRAAVRRISDAQKTNAALYNVCHLFAQLADEGQEPKAILKQLASELETARDRVARNFLKIAPDRGTVVTLTFSDNVLACLRLAHERGNLERVYVLESRPMNEGRFLVVALTEAGIRATLAPDPMGASLVGSSDYILVGADSVLRDASVVNKVGTYGLALAAADRGKPVYVACETLKFDARFDAASWPGSPEMPAREVWENPPEKIDVANRYFEVTPGRLVTRVATERGSFEPQTVRTMMAKAKSQM